jgi:glutamate-1-semialdehyde 2,1-aminomutase
MHSTMKKHDHTRALAALAEEYSRRSPRSASINKNALRVLVDGGSHAIRLLRPFPPRIREAHGAYITDEDGHQILDFWQGHHANILGHNPREITDVLAAAFARGFGLQSGFTDSLQVNVADLLCQRTGAERVRLTSSGSLATMYAIMLARTATGREEVLKVGGGWHGAQPWGLGGVAYNFQHAESRGLPTGVAEQVRVTPFNDVEALEEQFRRHGSRTACFILEPFMGSGGSLPASLSFLKRARELTRQHGALLIFDEVISGFRFCAGSTARLSSVQPDLATYAKIIGGGMPVAAVAGAAEVMQLARGAASGFPGAPTRAIPVPCSLPLR